MLLYQILVDMGFDPDGFSVSDTGSGPFISKWTLPDTQPTDAAIAANAGQAQIDFDKLVASSEVRRSTSDSIDGWPLVLDENEIASLTQGESELYHNDLDAFIIEAQAYEDAAIANIDAGTTLVEVQQAITDNESLLATLNTVSAFSIDEQKVRANRLIDSSAEVARMRYVTPGAGQAITYQEKADQAADYVAAGYPAELTAYPFIQAEVNATGKTSTQSADDILANRSAWITVGAQIEEVRLGGKLSTNNAITEIEIQNIQSTTITSLDAI